MKYIINYYDISLIGAISWLKVIDYPPQGEGWGKERGKMGIGVVGVHKHVKSDERNERSLRV